jgi:allophanate hydrolase
MKLLVVGAHLSGQPLNHQLIALGGELVGPARTSADYALYLLDTEPPKPGLVRVASEGVSIEGELWDLPPVGLASFLVALPPPMALGPVRLSDGSSCTGFLVEPVAVDGARDISEFRGWLSFLRDAGSLRR